MWQGFKIYILSVKSNVSRMFFLKRNLKFHNFFPDFERKILGVLTKNFRLGCQNCFIRVKRNFLGKNFFENNFVF